MTPQEVLSVRWEGLIDHPRDRSDPDAEVLVYCTGDGGQPVALWLGREVAGALAWALLDDDVI
ncbi:hypothetical protein [Marinitenerispora sediminis]|uniref:Uncharacterized protein n=1 Tax=Marinitenerispora sediminis TaxID=1931232 RepID=A0A368T6Q6_9ACTN|nr:hypothetical protein [Marinitenerispora sediminis]RCV53494.1 hypothetical protein DEF23_17600 [Marinitenerispora sediminis]RCV59322.1 hypothetical protein DEF24_10140 [Marinitenerispora sediminis]